MPKGIQRKIGYGVSDFDKASNILFSFNMTNMLDWIQIVSLPGKLSKGDPICTNSRFYNSPLWTLNPCKVVSVSKDVKTHQSHILYATVDGHLIAGEEIFRVFMSPKTQDVIFEIKSLSKGSGWLGKLCSPLIRPLQDKFLRENMESMQKLMSELN